MLEHLYNPLELLQNMHTILEDDGNLFISVPNLDFYSHKQFLLGMNYEHTYFLNEVTAMYLFENSNFNIISKKYFRNHSIFYHLKKKNTIPNLNINIVKMYNLGFKDLYFNEKQKIINLVKDINDKINNYKNVYVFGCFSNTQAMLYFGLNLKNIKFVLDNDSSKWDNYIYGYDLIIKSPKIIKNLEECCVICHVGEYTTEIKSELYELNSNVKFL